MRFNKDALELKDKNKKYSSEELELLLIQLEKQQSWLGVFFGTLAGTIIATFVYFIFGAMGGVLGWFLVIPAGIIGFFSAYLGRSYQLKYRLFPGLIAVLLHVGGVILLFPNNPLVLILTPACALIAIHFAKRKLTDSEEKAIWSKENKGW